MEEKVFPLKGRLFSWAKSLPLSSLLFGSKYDKQEVLMHYFWTI